MSSSLYIVMFVAIFALALQSSQALTEEKKVELKAKLVPILVECGKENGDITLDYLKEFRAQKKRPDDSNSCFFACVFKRIGLIDDKGLFSEEKAIERSKNYAEEGQLDKVKEAAKTCAAVNQEAVSDGEKGCDRAKLVYNCLAEQKEHFGFTY